MSESDGYDFAGGPSRSLEIAADGTTEDLYHVDVMLLFQSFDGIYKSHGLMLLTVLIP
jgi:hypothetical protein